MLASLKLRPVVKGALTFLPGMTDLLPEGGGETHSALYCYGVWLKHLVMLWRSGMRSMPSTLAELGPGSSLGTGLAAMLSGVNHYRALDVVEHSNIEANLRVFDELLELFQARVARPIKGWPDFDDFLDANLFPSQILTDERLHESLSPQRVAKIRRAIAYPDSPIASITIRYMAPWFDESAIEPNSIDLIISHAVLGEVVNLEQTYQTLHTWLKPGGWMSHQIGLEFHGINGAWNGYWACPEIVWKIIAGKRPFVLNRLPQSVHLDLIKRQGSHIICQLVTTTEKGIKRSELRPPWTSLSEDDFQCSGLFIQARK